MAVFVSFWSWEKCERVLCSLFGLIILFMIQKTRVDVVCPYIRVVSVVVVQSQWKRKVPYSPGLFNLVCSHQRFTKPSYFASTSTSVALYNSLSSKYHWYVLQVSIQTLWDRSRGHSVGSDLFCAEAKVKVVLERGFLLVVGLQPSMCLTMAPHPRLKVELFDGHSNSHQGDQPEQ